VVKRHAAKRSPGRVKEERMSPSLSPNELKKLLDSKNVTLVDVRRKADYEADPNLIPGAAWRNPEEVDAWSRELLQGKPVVVYCVKGGSVSQSITDALTRKQIDVRYIEGGLKAWKESGERVE
jgi:rhodanese-related sulfurtransferase